MSTKCIYKEILPYEAMKLYNLKSTSLTSDPEIDKVHIYIS